MVTQNAINSKNPVVQTIYSFTGALISCTTVMPIDNTIPQNTEGDQVLTATIIPQKTTSILKIDFYGQISFSNCSVALFQDTTANALAATDFYIAQYATGALTHIMAAGTTSSTTFKIRVGPATAATTYINGDNTGTRLYGGVAATSLVITEYMA